MAEETQTEMWSGKELGRQIGRLERVRDHLITERDKREKAVGTAEDKLAEACALLADIDAALEQLRKQQKGETIVVVEELQPEPAEPAEEPEEAEIIDEDHQIGAPPLQIEAGDGEAPDFELAVDAETGEVYTPPADEGDPESDPGPVDPEEADEPDLPADQEEGDDQAAAEEEPPAHRTIVDCPACFGSGVHAGGRCQLCEGRGCVAEVEDPGSDEPWIDSIVSDEEVAAWAKAATR